jgi:hypothetical protein
MSGQLSYTVDLTLPKTFAARDEAEDHEVASIKLILGAWFGCGQVLEWRVFGVLGGDSYLFVGTQDSAFL